MAGRKVAIAAVLGVVALGSDGVWATASAADGEGSVFEEIPSIVLGTPNAKGMQSVLDELDARQRALDRRERSIEAREADLRQVEAQLEGRIDEVEALRAGLMELLEEADAQRETKVRTLVKMLSATRSKQGAAIMGELDDDLAVEVFERMNTAKAGKIMAAMDPARAAKLAEMLTEEPLQQLDGEDQG